MSTKKLQIVNRLVTIDETLTQSGVAADAKAVGDAINAINTSLDSSIQPDWNQTDETQKDYIKNKPEDLAHTSDIPVVDTTLAVEGAAADAKATGDAVNAISALVGDEPVATQITEAIEANKVDLTGYATETYVDAKVAGLVDSAPETLNTLNELSAALGDDPNFAATVATQIGNKAEKEHTHTISELTDIGSASVNHATTADTANAVAWGNVTGKPSTYAPSAHNHAISDVTDLQDTLDTALANAKAYTDTEIAEWVGDKTVSAQISSAVSTKSDVTHTHKTADITDIGSASVSYASSAGAVAWANVSNKPSAYTPAAHGHAISDVTNLQTTLDGKVPTSRTVNGKALNANITLSASDVGADASGSATTALTNAKAYTDQQIDTFVGDTAVSTQIANATANFITQSDMESYINETFLGGAW